MRQDFSTIDEDFIGQYFNNVRCILYQGPNRTKCNFFKLSHKKNFTLGNDMQNCNCNIFVGHIVVEIMYCMANLSTVDLAPCLRTLIRAFTVSLK